MAKYISKGENMPYTNSGETTIEAGTVVVVGDTLGIAADDIPAGEEGNLFMTGVFELPAVNNAAIGQGDAVYYDSTAGKITSTATDNIACGYAWAAKAETATTILVRINAFSIVIQVEAPAG